jgi:hypothetical protein
VVNIYGGNAIVNLEKEKCNIVICNDGTIKKKKNVNNNRDILHTHFLYIIFLNQLLDL